MMLRPRITPCLLIRNGGLVKTQKFADSKYVGDPLNAVRIFNEKEVDELIVLDIDATVLGQEPNYDLIRDLASECRMPLCYGGGVKSVEQIAKIVGLGVEKVAVSSAAVHDPGLVRDAACVVGSQSVAVVLDVKKSGWRSQYEVWTHNGTQRTGLGAVDFAKRMQDGGAGEIVINSVDQDGLMSGYDLTLAKSIRKAVRVPMTVLGGAGSLQHVRDLIDSVGVVGAAAGSLFVFKGVYRAVLISYPSRAEKDSISSALGADSQSLASA